jgi:hypothetical protein
MRMKMEKKTEKMMVKFMKKKAMMFSEKKMKMILNVILEQSTLIILDFEQEQPL